MSSKNELQIAMKLKNKAKVGSYPDIEVGDNVRLTIIHKTPKGFKQQWSTDLHTVQKDSHNGVYKVDGDLYPRKELQVVKGNVVKLPEKSKQKQTIISKMDKVGKAATDPHVKQLMNTKNPDPKLIEHLQDTGRTTRDKNRFQEASKRKVKVEILCCCLFCVVAVAIQKNKLFKFCFIWFGIDCC